MYYSTICGFVQGVLGGKTVNCLVYSIGMTLAHTLLTHENKEKARFLSRFFKTGKGEYAEGDRFLGLSVPFVRSVCKEFYTLSIPEILGALKNPYHEVRLAALYVLVYQYERGNDGVRKNIFDFYIENTRYINNWDLVDTSVYKIVGRWVFEGGGDVKVIRKLAKSRNMWERRMAMVACFAEIRMKKCEVSLEIAETLIGDTHDLMHKAVGWMLREVGKKCGEKTLRAFLDMHASTMPRMALRYAIERFDPPMRQKYLRMKTSV